MDIRKRKPHELAVCDGEEFFRSVAEQCGDFVVVLDVQGRRLYSSPSYERFFGDTHRLIGTDSFAEIHPDDRELVRHAFMETVRTGIGKHLEFRFVLPDGSVRHMESRGGVVLDADGRVLRVVVVSNDISDRKQAENRMHSLAFYDGLTKLPNRRMLYDQILRVMAASKRNSCFGALIFIDLDNLKLLNDLHGHAVGDALLCEVARRIKGCVREVDTVARLGGDEFVVLLADLYAEKNSSEAKAWFVADKVRSNLNLPYALTVAEADRPPVTVLHQSSASLGIVLFHGDELPADDLVRYADVAMYQAKRAGRNCIKLIDPVQRRDAATAGNQPPC